MKISYTQKKMPLLRKAEVPEETVADILWHTRPGMTAHYSVAQVAALVEALNRITDERHRPTGAVQ